MLCGNKQRVEITVVKEQTFNNLIYFLPYWCDSHFLKASQKFQLCSGSTSLWIFGFEVGWFVGGLWCGVGGCVCVVGFWCVLVFVVIFFFSQWRELVVECGFFVVFLQHSVPGVCWHSCLCSHLANLARVLISLGRISCRASSGLIPLIFM